MSSYSRVVILGNLTRDVELRYTNTGKAVCNMTLAVNDRQDVAFIEVTAWERTAEVASEFLSKGSQCLIEGRLKQDSWEQEGQKRTKIVVVADRLVLTGKKDDSQQASQTQSSQPVQQEVPF